MGKLIIIRLSEMFELYEEAENAIAAYERGDFVEARDACREGAANVANLHDDDLAVASFNECAEDIERIHCMWF